MTQSVRMLLERPLKMVFWCCFCVHCIDNSIGKVFWFFDAFTILPTEIKQNYFLVEEISVLILIHHLNFIDLSSLLIIWIVLKVFINIIWTIIKSLSVWKFTSVWFFAVQFDFLISIPAIIKAIKFSSLSFSSNPSYLECKFSRRWRTFFFYFIWNCRYNARLSCIRFLVLRVCSNSKPIHLHTIKMNNTLQWGSVYISCTRLQLLPYRTHEDFGFSLL